MSELDDLLKPWLATYSLAQIARLAGIHPNQMSNLMSGRRKVSRRTLGRIEFAISRLRQKQTGGTVLVTGLYRFMLALCAGSLGLDAAIVLPSRPAAKQAANKIWRDASFARWLAWYLMNTGCNVTQAEIARTVGVTKQAVSLAMREIEDKREDTEFDGLVVYLEFILSGERYAQ